MTVDIDQERDLLIQQRVKILKQICKGFGATAKKLEMLSETELAVFYVESVDAFKKKIQLLAIFTEMDARFKYITRAGLNLEQDNELRFLARIYSAGSRRRESDRTVWRQFHASLLHIATLVDSIDTDGLVMTSEQPTVIRIAETEAVAVENQLVRKRVKQLEKLFQSLLKSRGVAESTKDILRRHL
jgi:hypothetical protein